MCAICSLVNPFYLVNRTTFIVVICTYSTVTCSNLNRPFPTSTFIRPLASMTHPSIFKFHDTCEISITLEICAYLRMFSFSQAFRSIRKPFSDDFGIRFQATLRLRWAERRAREITAWLQEHREAIRGKRIEDLTIWGAIW